MHWLTVNAVNIVGFMVLCALLLYLRDKPRTTRMRIALALGIFAVACFAAVYLLP
jgi:hypothetical protein